MKNENEENRFSKIILFQIHNYINNQPREETYKTEDFYNLSEFQQEFQRFVTVLRKLQPWARALGWGSIPP